MHAFVAISIDQWVDYVNSSVSPLSHQLSQLVFGHEQTDIKAYSILLNQFKRAILPFEKHLKLRNFLVGYSLTLADVTLVVALLAPLQTLLEATYRSKEIPALTRYATLILEGAAFRHTFGRVHFAKMAIQIQFPVAQ
jgi:glutathione S-transferase